ncbi:MAG TPA: AarF/UbiB family protein [Jatrophihabitantaceae bacterium]|jgi:predicted unusual protein kinase regulating ubiquinone biosynthesis (AarF/ABC1/UbiB family)|nr:AarF/UbiB family protein [Jatrophihabitantaceae bacterium]
MATMPDRPEGFRGPFADGPTAAALTVAAPSLTRFGLAELIRMIFALVLMPTLIVVALVRWLPRPNRRPMAEAASGGLVSALVRLGPTYVKFGQLIACTPGIFPDELADACQSCLDDVPPFSPAQARRAIEADLGRPIRELFSIFEERPLSAASIAQVHGCVLPDGRVAVVKVQRPDIRRRMTTDLRIAYRLARILELLLPTARIANVVAIVEDLHAVTFAELNPVLEASRQHRFRAAIATFGDNRWVTAPEVYWDYCGHDVICMERLFGRPLDEFAATQTLGSQSELILRRGVKVWLEAVTMHGPFHGDVHAGNLWVLADGRLAFLDFGIVGELDEQWRQSLRDILYTLLVDRDFTRIARNFRRLGVVNAASGSDEQVALRLQLIAAPLLEAGIGSFRLGDIVTAFLRFGRDFDGASPRELVLFGKQLAYFERYSKDFAPAWVPMADPWLFRNIFPVETAAIATDRGISYPD